MKLSLFFLWILILYGIEGSTFNRKTRASTCKSGWTQYNDSCYLFVRSEADNWTDAYLHCNILHGYLADILNDDESNFIKGHLKSNNETGCFYISATDIELEGHWIWANSDDPVQYTDWAPTEPQNFGSGENCVCLNMGHEFRWADVSCDTKTHFICRAEMDLRIFFLVILVFSGIEGLAFNRTKRASYCRNGWTRYNDSCYLFVNSEGDNWTDAYYHCTILHGYLADISNKDENDFIKAQLKSRHEPGCFYISATDVELEGHWIWANSDDPVQYTDWGPTEPQNAGSGENCVCLSHSTQFQWADVTCDRTLQFICKTKLTDMGAEVIG
ncbi:macrophage mannose receptor 1-like [Argopecten irradians]|uniref:macrophage mannose receptor 1-like n=1 Tax=Argopecten irradians TaxID=31199 RepID=UPI003714DA53